MQRKNFNSFGKIKLVILIFVIVNMTLALGILIGQRNIFNSSYSGTLNVKNESGLKFNILSDLKERPLMGLGQEALEVGSLKYLVQGEKIEFKFELKTNYKNLSFQKEKKELPKNYSIETLIYGGDQIEAKYEKIGTILLDSNEEGLKGSFAGTIDNNALQVKQIVLKNIDKEQGQDYYLYNDKSVPETLNNQPMPYFWVNL